MNTNHLRKGDYLYYFFATLVGGFLLFMGIAGNYVYFYDNVLVKETTIIYKISETTLIIGEIDKENSSVTSYIREVKDTSEYEIGTKKNFNFELMDIGSLVLCSILLLFGIVFLFFFNKGFINDTGWKWKYSKIYRVVYRHKITAHAFMEM